MIFSKKIPLMLSSLMLASCLEAGIFQLPPFPALRISPIPGPTNPDPILSNLEAVMDDWFVLPFTSPPPSGYPGGAPDYLSQVLGSFNTYTIGTVEGGNNADIQINPINDKIMVVPFFQNRFRILPPSNGFIPFSGTYTLGRSTDGGLSWEYLPPVEAIMPLGGTLSQQLDGARPVYAKDGTLYMTGFFDDMHTNPPFAAPMQGNYFSKSFDNGTTWTAPKVFASSAVTSQFFYAGLTGVGIYGSALLPDPQDAKRLHINYATIVLPTTYYGSIYYVRSCNGGETFTDPVQIYNMADDPVWQAEHYDPDFVIGPGVPNSEFYPDYGGQVTTGRILVIDKDILVAPVWRSYPSQGSTTYNQDPADTTWDIGVVRSTNNGKTWDPVAYVTEPFIFPFSHDPAAISSSSVFLNDGQGSIPIIYSTFTGRIYMVNMHGNPNVSPDPQVQQFFPYIALNVSYDKGLSWSPTIQINQTPTDISFDRQQAIRPNIIGTSDGYVVVAYYDYRNWLGTTTEDVFTTPLNVDGWLDIYKEVPDPNGGSTGVGLDFVQEIRVTPQSFNGRITLLTNEDILRTPYGTAATTGIGLSLDQNNKLIVTFSMNNPFDFSELDPVTVGYEGLLIDENNRANIFLERYKFPNASNL